VAGGGGGGGVGGLVSFDLIVWAGRWRLRWRPDCLSPGVCRDRLRRVSFTRAIERAGCVCVPFSSSDWRACVGLASLVRTDGHWNSQRQLSSLSLEKRKNERSGSFFLLLFNRPDK
jgi:hypothetical protein